MEKIIMVGIDLFQEVVHETNTRFVRAFNRGDMLTAATVYTEDARLLPPNAPMITGKQAIQQFWANAKVGMGIKQLSLQTIDLEYVGDVAFEIGAYSLITQPPGGVEAVDKGKYVVVWQRQPDTTWKWHVDIFNSDLPAPGQ